MKISEVIFDLAGKQKRLEEIEHLLSRDGFWDQPEKSTAILKERTRLSTKIDAFTSLVNNLEESELLLELANMDKEAIYDRAEELFLEEEYSDARRYFSFIYDTFPNDPLGHKAALRVADTYAMKNDMTSLTEARLRFRDFANRYPNDPDRDYALLMLGQTYAGNKKRPDRDLSTLQESLDSYNQLIALYPDSSYVDLARERITELREILAEHEFQVATYYARNNRWRGVLGRMKYLDENYPEYSKSEEVQALMAEAQNFVTEPAGCFFAVARNKRYGVALVDQLDCACRLFLVYLQFVCNSF